MTTEFVQRQALASVLRALASFRVVIVNGPRQSGKSTLLEFLQAEVGGMRLTLDDRDVLRAARTDPAGFVLDARYPLMIDEVQRGGDPLILAIKADVDRHGHEHGRYVLAGSSRFLTVPTLTESLAGRARIIELWPLSQAERDGVIPKLVDALFEPTEALRQVPVRVETRASVLGRVAIGGFPAATMISDSRSRTDWFSDYVSTLLQRDLAQLRSPRRAVDLPRLLRLIGQRTAAELVVAPLASDLGLTADTVKDYLGLFESIYLHYTIPAWTAGGTGRVVHRPKLHLVDSGIACHLFGVGVEELSRPGNTAVGAIFESFVAGEVQRQIPMSELQPALYHYRDNSQREVDLVLESRDGRIAAVEVKAAVGVDDSDFRHLKWLRDQLGDRFVNGVVCHLGDKVLPAGDRLTSLPVSALWSS